MTLSLLALNSICDSRGEIKLLRFVSVPRDVTSISDRSPLRPIIAFCKTSLQQTHCSFYANASDSCLNSVNGQSNEAGCHYIKEAQNVFQDNKNVKTCAT